MERSLCRLLVMAIVLAQPVSGFAAAKAAKVDSEAPTITHSALTEAPAGVSLTISATIIDESEVFEPTLYYRQIGSKKFLTTSMLKSGVIYSAAIPEAIMQADVEYFIEAYDANGNGPALFASNSAPQKVKVTQLVVPLPPPPPPKEEPKVEEPKPTEIKVIEFKPIEEPKPEPKPTERIIVTGPVETKKEVEPPPAPGRGMKIAGFSLLAVGAGGVGLGAYLGSQATENAKQAQGTLKASEARVKEEDAQFKATLANVCFIAGGALAVGGLVLAIIPSPQNATTTGGSEPSSPKPSGDSSLDMSLFVAPSGVGMTMHW